MNQKRNAISHFLLSTSLVLILVLQGLQARPSITLTAENETGFTVDFRNPHVPRSPDPNAIIEADRDFSIEGFQTRRTPDGLYLPFLAELIALPRPNAPKITLLSQQYRSLTSRDQEFPEKFRNSFPTAVMQITNIGFYGNIPSAMLEIHPLRYNRQTRRIEVLETAQFQISFPADTRPGVHSTPDPKSRKTVKADFLNNRYAHEWEQRPERSLAKAQSYPSGKWMRIAIWEDAVYYLSLADFADLFSNAGELDANRIFLYSNSTGGAELPGQPGLSLPENLVQNALLLTGSDDRLDSGDSLLFWGKSTSGLRTTHQRQIEFQQNCYADTNYYWLLLADQPGNPKRMSSRASAAAAADSICAHFEKVDHHEVEATNFLRSGKRWYGEKFTQSGSSVSVLFDLPNFSTEYPAEIRIRTKGGNDDGVRHSYSLYINHSDSPVYGPWTAYNYSSSYISFNRSLDPGLNILRIDYTSKSSSAAAYLDYIECRYLHELKPQNQPLPFWAPRDEGLVEYDISDIDLADPVVFDVTDFRTVSIQEYDAQENNRITFRADNDLSERRQYYLCSSDHYQHPEIMEIIDNPSWNQLRNPANAADYIIITADEFLPAAEQLATLHSEEVKEAERLDCLIATQGQILREFNADIPDPHAIRLFLQYAYENWAKQPRYVVLFGDGTYDYRGITSSENNFVFTYQVEIESELDGGFTSYATDARFAYVHGSDKNMDIAIGRLPCRSLAEANNIVEKIRKYITEPLYGAWRNRITLVADDPVRPNTNEKYHIRDSENYVVDNLPVSFSLNKLYLLEYPEVQDASTYGVTKPAATVAILNALKNGTTIINYLGHGSATVWAQEHVLEMERDLGNINTDMKLPFWIAATCSWGHFDDINEICMPEALLTLRQDGAIAALAATRVVFATSNAAFVEDVLQRWFSPDQIRKYRLGDLLRPIISGAHANDEKYVLFGDPALYLALPYERFQFAPLSSDTLKSLSSVGVSGSVAENPQNFQGSGFFTVLDSRREVTRAYVDGNKESQSLTYTLPGEQLFKGNIEIADGQFDGRFFVPKDLNFQNNFGLMNLYAWDPNTGIEISGVYDGLVFTGSESVGDTIGPHISIGFRDYEFFSGDPIAPDTPLEIRISDPLGINIAGKLGHDILIQFDDNEEQSYQATEYFAYDANSDTSGILAFELPALAAGKHNIHVTAWDNANNPSSARAEFTLLADEDFALQRVVNYPNPFHETTEMTFYLTQPAEVSIEIYTVRGLRIRQIEITEPLDAGFQHIFWDGRDDFGDRIARGIYLYKIKAMSLDSEQKTNFIGKMVKAG